MLGTVDLAAGFKVKPLRRLRAVPAHAQVLVAIALAGLAEDMVVAAGQGASRV